DNRRYGHPSDPDLEGMLTGLTEICRVLTPGGRLLLTLPCGAPEDHGWFAQKDVEGWMDLVRRSGLDTLELEVFALESHGWRPVPARMKKPKVTRARGRLRKRRIGPRMALISPNTSATSRYPTAPPVTWMPVTIRVVT